MMRAPIDRFVTRKCAARRVPATRGYALIAALILLVLASLAVMVAVHRGDTEGKRERELQLLFIGDQYRNAIRSYYATIPPGGTQQYPKRLEDLVEDARTPAMLRHLRALYADPLTGKFDWDLEMAGDRITGVRSPSAATPLLHAHFSGDDSGFADAKSYHDWVFSAAASSPAGVAVAAVSPGPASAGTPPLAPPTVQPPPELQLPATPPVTNHVIDCYNQFQVPRSQCYGPSPPMGNNAISCQKALLNAYAQCMAGN